MPTPTFSIVIPLYNKADFIRRALDSALAQTGQDFEVIVIDDGSTDNGVEIVSQVGDPRIRLIKQANSGASAARNRGVEVATGGLVAFLDADDEWFPGYLQAIAELVHQYPTAGIYATGYLYYPKNKEKRKIRNKYIPKEPHLFNNPFYCYIGEPLFFTSSVVVPRQVLQKAGGFPVGIRLGEDIETWLKIGLAHPIAYSPKELVNYRRDTSINTCDTEDFSGEPRYMEMMQNLWKSGTIKESSRKAFSLFVNHQKITLAKIYLSRGEYKKTRQILLQFCPQFDYILQWMIILVASFFPFILRYIQR